MMVYITVKVTRESCTDYDGVYISQSPQRDSCIDYDGCVYQSKSPESRVQIMMVYISVKVPREIRV